MDISAYLFSILIINFVSETSNIKYCGGCKDFVANCASFGESACSNDKSAYMAKNCRKFCHFCGGPKCENKKTEAECKSFEKGSQICTSKKYKGWAVMNCNKFCGFCGTKTECKDKDDDCSFYVQLGFCKDDEEYMKTNCKKSCKFC